MRDQDRHAAKTTNLPRDVNIPQYHDLTSTKKSHVRINDQLIPDPTKINICEKVITDTTQRHHPYQSHVSQFAMFPNFCFPVDPETEVQAAGRSHLDPLVPAKIPKITILSKTKGAPYRHEVLERPADNRTHVLTCPEQQGFHLSRPDEGQKFYPTAPKTMCTNKSLCPLDFTLSERRSKILQNLERSHRVTSYQRDFTGAGLLNLRKLDDFHERTVTGETTPHSLQLVNRDFSTRGLAKGTGSTQTFGSEVEQVRNIPPVSSRMEYKDSPYSKKQTYAMDNHSFGSIQPASATATLARVSKAEQRPRSAPNQETCSQPCSSPVSPSRGLRVSLPSSKSVLLDLQDSFSKTEALRHSRQVLHGRPLDLQDNVCKGRRHYLYGFNSYYFRN
ncbi:uncharacterized protein C7orf31 homolog [Brienomyrus brachyistius]|uniref:uncharacterized protein C7orf31 homolog n=1 Tax=Brienomyrus brachyistius TaxID=42636 RepID=UPI0020B437B0|nr:uncharacterized protein C7orf31 homolog [Brienomyrus brachyistius]